MSWSLDLRQHKLMPALKKIIEQKQEFGTKMAKIKIPKKINNSFVITQLCNLRWVIYHVTYKLIFVNIIINQFGIFVIFNIFDIFIIVVIFVKFFIIVILLKECPTYNVIYILFNVIKIFLRWLATVIIKYHLVGNSQSEIILQLIEFINLNKV